MPASRRIGAANHKVASDHDLVYRLSGDVVQGRLKGRQVSMDVGEDGNAHQQSPFLSLCTYLPCRSIARTAFSRPRSARMRSPSTAARRFIPVSETAMRIAPANRSADNLR